MDSHSLGFGVDIGGTGIKSAPVDLDNGRLVSPRMRLLTPKPSLPDAVCRVMKETIDNFEWEGEIGVTFPAVIKNGVALSAANVDKSWIGTDVSAISEQITGRKTIAINDADAAGLAELRFGAARDCQGVVFVLTFGTGIGSALFSGGHLVPNTELGHIELDGKDAEKTCSEVVREKKKLTWADWTTRVAKYLAELDKLFSPDLFIIGGGASRKAEKFLPMLTEQCKVPVVAATLGNDAGIVGAALAAAGRA